MDKIFIIAEAGVNHNGCAKTAKKMVDIAYEAGADAVKFQTFEAESLVIQNAPKARYQEANTGIGESQFDMLKRLVLPREAFGDLMLHCRQRGLYFMSTPYDEGSADFLNGLGMEIFKIPSGEITNLPYLRKIGSLGKKIIMSTGMSDLAEIKSALDVLISSGTPKDNITVLHCNSEYPTPAEDANLTAMAAIRDAFKIDVGYSDHTLGIEVSIAAAALGAKVIEKHFTLDRNMAGPDHKASLIPEELESMVKAIRNIEKALGDGIKKPSCSELKNKMVGRRSIVARKIIKKGNIIQEEDIAAKRPQAGISAMEWDRVIGATAKRDFKENEAIEL